MNAHITGDMWKSINDQPDVLKLDNRRLTEYMQTQHTEKETSSQ